MIWSPSDDPWGAGMLVSSVWWGAALLAVAARSLSRRSTDIPAGLMTFGATSFLVCAALGAMQAPRTPEPRPAASSESETAAAEPSPEQAPEPEAEPKAPEAPAPPTAPPPPASVVPEPPPLPTDDAERRTAIRNVLRNARLVYEDEEACKDPAEVGRVWKALEALPQDARNARAKAVVKRLETCRRQVRWATMFVVHRDRLAAREAFADALRQRLEDDLDLDAQVKTFGKEQERLRVGSGALDDALADAILTEALLAEAAALGFESVTLARPGQTWREPVEPRPDAAVVDETLAPYGLDRPLKLSPR